MTLRTGHSLHVEHCQRHNGSSPRSPASTECLTSYRRRNMDAQEIIKFIADSKKVTPVKIYLREKS
ncbi:MAG: hypothetical protein IJG39_01185, partial [Synergistaceae bacterium]|nr:hypothetical protein [Synergistaceae bacterium]